MFVSYARGGRSTQVLTKGLYGPGGPRRRRAVRAGNLLFRGEAAQHPELFYGQLALERLGRAVPAPPRLPPSL
jgi:soluble lytic murein transglycosylase